MPKIFRFDDGCCERCGSGCGELNQHHAKSKMDGGTDHKSNLFLLCKRCHNEWHDVEGGNLRFREWITSPPHSVLCNVLFLAGTEMKLVTIHDLRKLAIKRLFRLKTSYT